MKSPFFSPRSTRRLTLAFAFALAGVGGPVWLRTLPIAVAAATEQAQELILDGVIVAATPSDSVALVRRTGGGRARVLRIGQEIDGYVLVGVTKTEARFEGPAGGLSLRIGAAGSLPPEPRTSPAESDDDGWIRRSIPRATAKQRLSREIPVILRETDVSPRIEDGEVRGLKVSRLPDGTLLAESGLLPGDIVLSVDGKPLHGVDSLWDLLSRLLDEDEIRVVVRRRGEVLKLAYDLTP